MNQDLTPDLYAFGESFKEHSAQHYKNIDYLFRTRNKVAHMG